MSKIWNVTHYDIVTGAPYGGKDHAGAVFIYSGSEDFVRGTFYDCILGVGI